MEAVGTTAATGALMKSLGVPLGGAAVAAALGFMFLWPKTAKEAAIRIASTVIASAFFGPPLVIALHSSWPSLFESASVIAGMSGTSPAQGFLFLAAPLMVMAGLPAWWVLGAIVRWLEKRKDKDIGELMADARQLMHQVKGDA